MNTVGVGQAKYAACNTPNAIQFIIEGDLYAGTSSPQTYEWFTSTPTLITASGTGGAVQINPTVAALTGLLISKETYLNVSGGAVVLSMYYGGVASGDLLRTFTIPAGGWLEYEPNAQPSWTIYNSAGLALSTSSPVGTTNQAAYFSAPTTVASTALLTFVSGQLNANGSVIFAGPVPWYDLRGSVANCKCDGSTNDSTAFTAFLTTIAGGGIMYLGEGYNLNLGTAGPYTLPGQTVILGMERQGSIISTPGGITTGDLFQLAAADNYITIKGIQFFSNGTRSTGSCINTNGASDVLIQECEFSSGWFNCLGVQGSSIKVEAEDCVFANGVNAHVLINNGSAGDTYLTRCVFDGSSTCTNNILVNATGHYSVLQCNVTNAVNGMQVNPGAGQVVNDGFITHTLFDSCQTNCLNLNASTSTSTIKGLTFVNSWMSGAGTVGGHTNATAVGVLTQGVAGGVLSHITFIGCRILNNGLHGVNHTFGNDLHFNACWIAGNCNTSSGSSANTGDGILIASTAGSIHIVGNRIGGNDTSETTSTQRWGVNVVTGNATITTYTIMHNDLRANGVSGTVTGGGPLTDNGPSTNITSSSPTFVGKITGPNIGAIGRGPIAATTGAVAITTGEASVVSAFIPFNSLQVGTILKISVWGTSTSTAAAGTCTVRVRFGPTTLTGTAVWNVTPTTVATLAVAGTADIETTIYITVNALSATVASFTSTGGTKLFGNVPTVGISGATPASLDFSNTVATLNTSVNNLLQFTALQSVGSMSLNGLIEVMNP